MPAPPPYGLSKVPDSVLIIQDFIGMTSNADPHDLKPGASPLQINATAQRPGEVRVRGGFKFVTFEA